jgi:hypothetical protein
LRACRNLVEFFKEEVDLAYQEQRLETSQEVSFYLVNLLDTMTKGEALRVYLDEPLALLLHRAVFSHPGTQVSAYRLLGDVSLCLAGLFAPSLRRRAVDVPYAIGMGSGAYATVAVLTRPRGAISIASAIPVLYREMAEKFPALVEVLTQIGERHALGHDSPDVAELYERWARTKGPHLMARMRGHGVFPSMHRARS